MNTNSHLAIYQVSLWQTFNQRTSQWAKLFILGSFWLFLKKKVVCFVGPVWHWNLAMKQQSIEIKSTDLGAKLDPGFNPDSATC